MTQVLRPSLHIAQSDQQDGLKALSGKPSFYTLLVSEISLTSRVLLQRRHADCSLKILPAVSDVYRQ